MEILDKRIFDTRFDTKKIFVTTTHRFSLRNYKDREGNSLIYLDIRDKKSRLRVPTEIKIPAASWDASKQRIKKSTNQVLQETFNGYNLLLENWQAKLIQIKTTYALRSAILDAHTMLEEFQTASPNFDFISFYRHHLENMTDLSTQTIKNHNAVLTKLSDFRKEIPFHKIDETFFAAYRKHYSYNAESTFNTDVKCMKKFLRIALKKGIQINIDLEDLKVRFNYKSRIYLFPNEVQKLIKYYYNEFIPEHHIIPLGYFLISCYTGLRISDLLKRKREELFDIFQFNHQKNGNFQSMKLNQQALEILKHSPDLFINEPVEQTINENLKTIAKNARLPKKITMHVGRHTFATTYYRNNKDILKLQKLLGHSSLKSTMVYVHLVDGEELDDIETVTF